MDPITRQNFANLHAPEAAAQYQAFVDLIATINKPVDWAYEVWDDLVAKLKDKDPHERARAAQFLSGLALSDPKNRMLKDFDKVMAVTHDEKFVTARHTLQSVWKVGLAGPKQRKLVLDRLAGRFRDCAAEKNCTLIRYDIQVGLRQLYDAVKDEGIRKQATALIETEPDLKFRKKYATVWRKA
ncbi:MAG: hypothetical protein ABI847_16140 [Anaerolineales bacterium]